MEKCPRAILFPEDLRGLSGGSNKTFYRLYNAIRLKFGLDKGVRITIYHLRDYLKLA